MKQLRKQYLNNLEILLIIVSVLIGIPACNTEKVFSEVTKIKSMQELNRDKSGFYGLKDFIIFKEENYVRYICLYEGEILIDGYWHYDKHLSALQLIPYHTVYQGCDIEPLLFCNFSSKTAHYLGNSCAKKNSSAFFDSEILVRYTGDGNAASEEMYFMHSLIDDEGERDSLSDKINFGVETRFYCINYNHGLRIDSIESKGIHSIFRWPY